MTHTNSKCLFVGDFCLSNGELTMHPYVSSMHPCAKTWLSEVSILYITFCYYILGRVCVPISMRDVDTFDPFTVPTIRFNIALDFFPNNSYYPEVKAG